MVTKQEYKSFSFSDKELGTVKALKVFDRHYAEASAYLAAYGDSALDRNQAITLWYHETARKSVHLPWFSAATLGSANLGEVLEQMQQESFLNCERSQTVYQGLACSNQEIFKNIFAAYHTYIELGSKALALVSAARPDTVTKEVVEVFTAVQNFYNGDAYQLRKDLGQLWYYKHANQFEKYQMTSETAKILKEISIGLTAHEQQIVQKTYEQSFFKNGPTVGEVLSDPEWVGHKACESGQYLQYSHGEITNIDNRLSFFSDVFDAYFQTAMQKGGMQQLEVERAAVVDRLTVEYIPPTVVYENEVSAYWPGGYETIGVSQQNLNTILQRENKQNNARMALDDETLLDLLDSELLEIRPSTELDLRSTEDLGLVWSEIGREACILHDPLS